MTAGFDEHRVKRLLRTLVGIRTENPPGREIEAAAFIGSQMREIGFDVTIDEFEPGRANVVGRLENGPGPVFAFNSHIDVVPVGEGWSFDPFDLTEKDGFLYGRGSCDAKGPIVAMLEGMRLLAAAKRDWSGTLLGVFVADEETLAHRGARAYVEGQPALDYVIVGEPTSNHVVTAHKGTLRPWVRVYGESAHSASPSLGSNAIFNAGRLLALIEARHGEICGTRHALVGAPSLTVTRINGGHADNVVPDRSEILLDRRLVPGEDLEAVRREVETLLEAAAGELGVKAEIVRCDPGIPPGETPGDSAIVRACVASVKGQGIGDGALSGFQGACDLAYFRLIGAEGAILGPGAISVAHKPNEYVPFAELCQAILIYRDIAKRILVRDRDRCA